MKERSAAGGQQERVSFVIPVYNEEENLPRLFEQLVLVVNRLDRPCEIIFVDDGSSDNSLAVIRALAQQSLLVKYLALATNSGQSAALAAGFEAASGEVVVTMDSDLQNDPADIPLLLQYYGDYDMVNGWRFKRQDTLSKRIGSRLGNFVRNRLTGEAIHDTGCSLKVMRAGMLKRVRMYRGLHRFLPTLMRLEGARVKEVKVNHRPRLHGVSNYTNLRRGIEGLYDLFAVRWMIKRHLTVQVRERHV
jgi:dolichol-phosphate mannosyltransferase